MFQFQNGKRLVNSYKVLATTILTLCGLLTSGQCQAAIFVTALDSSAIPGSTDNFFDVEISNTGPMSVDIGGFSIDLSVPAASGVMFTSVATSPTAVPYIFAGTGSVDFLGFPFSFDLFPNTSFIAADIEFVSLVVPLGPSETLSLGRVFYDMSSTVPLGTMIPVELGAFTDVSDALASPIPFTPVDGTITATPEPGSILIWFLMAGMVAALAVRQRRRVPETICVANPPE